MKEQSITVFTSFFMLSWWFYECWVYKLFVDRVIERQSNIRTFLWRVFECIGQQMRTNNSLTCPLVNLSTRNFVTQKNLVHLLLCLSIILSFLASNSFTCYSKELCSHVTLSFYYPVFYKQLIPPLVEVCKLFSCVSKPTHALLASKRRPIDLQKVPFKTLTNALLKSY